ncbi:unnamed protein product [Microthlaspi erraticum]|uniref:Uncharacterized protein n=1 Tax=Microthlaspi erraticum TaxID=1685480 RepID=A0A6D2KLG7_9BRAS|nr:unnamed protein product [Microthlaspi erraticum]
MNSGSFLKPTINSSPSSTNMLTTFNHTTTTIERSTFINKEGRITMKMSITFTVWTCNNDHSFSLFLSRKLVASPSSPNSPIDLPANRYGTSRNL